MTDLSTHLDGDLATEEDVDEVFAAFTENSPEEVAALDDLGTARTDVPDDFEGFLAELDADPGPSADGLD